MCNTNSRGKFFVKTLPPSFQDAIWFASRKLLWQVDGAPTHLSQSSFESILWTCFHICSNLKIRRIPPEPSILNWTVIGCVSITPWIAKKLNWNKKPEMETLNLGKNNPILEGFFTLPKLVFQTYWYRVKIQKHYRLIFLLVSSTQSRANGNWGNFQNILFISWKANRNTFILKSCWIWDSNVCSYFLANGWKQLGSLFFSSFFGLSFWIPSLGAVRHREEIFFLFSSGWCGRGVICAAQPLHLANMVDGCAETEWGRRGFFTRKQRLLLMFFPVNMFSSDQPLQKIKKNL